MSWVRIHHLSAAIMAEQKEPVPSPDIQKLLSSSWLGKWPLGWYLICLNLHIYIYNTYIHWYGPQKTKGIIPDVSENSALSLVPTVLFLGVSIGMKNNVGSIMVSNIFQHLPTFSNISQHLPTSHHSHDSHLCLDLQNYHTSTLKISHSYVRWCPSELFAPSWCK